MNSLELRLKEINEVNEKIVNGYLNKLNILEVDLLNLLNIPKQSTVQNQIQSTVQNQIQNPKQSTVQNQVQNQVQNPKQSTVQNQVQNPKQNELKYYPVLISLESLKSNYPIIHEILINNEIYRAQIIPSELISGHSFSYIKDNSIFSLSPQFILSTNNLYTNNMKLINNTYVITYEFKYERKYAGYYVNLKDFGLDRVVKLENILYNNQLNIQHNQIKIQINFEIILI